MKRRAKRAAAKKDSGGIGDKLIEIGVNVAVGLAHAIWQSVTTPAKAPRKRATRRETNHGQTAPARRSKVSPPWWEILQVSPQASAEQIKEAYREKVRQTHPDKVSHLSEKLKAVAHEETQRLNEAYDAGLRACS